MPTLGTPLQRHCTGGSNGEVAAMTVNLSLGRPLVTLIDEISASTLETLQDTVVEWTARLTAV